MITTKPTVKVKRLFWDIETSLNVVLAFRAGYDLNIQHEAIVEERKVITIAYKWEGDGKIYVLKWDRDQNDRSMLTKFMAVAEEADELVAHYGDRFDLPWFKTRCLIHGLPPLPPYKTVDTKAWASKYFYFNSNKLDYIGQVLGLGRKIKTDFDLWKDIQLKKCPVALAKMCRYNARDVDLLEQVYHKLKFCVKPKTHAGVFGGLDKWTCPRTGSTNVEKAKTRVTSSGTVTHQMKNKDDGSYFTISDVAFNQYKAMKKKKKGTRC